MKRKNIFFSITVCILCMLLIFTGCRHPNTEKHPDDTNPEHTTNPPSGTTSEDTNSEHTTDQPSETTPNDTDTYTEGLVYEKSGNAYTVVGVGEETQIIIPAEYEGLPITAIQGHHGTGAFAQKNITSVVIPDSVTVIGQNTFYGCRELLSVTVGENSALTEIGNNAFSACSSLTSMYIPKGVTTIGDMAFNNCASLQSFTVAEGNTVYRSENGHLIERATGTLIRGAANSTVPSGIKVIAQGAFRRTVGITELNIPKSVTEIGNCFIQDSTIAVLNYEGTEEEWKTIKKSGKMWNYGNRDVEVRFADTTDQPSDPITPDANNVLILYFSYSGNTRRVAELIIAQSGGDGVEILPKIPYTAADVNYNDSSSRSQAERRTDARPEISEETYGKIDLSEYQTVIIGYPIWNGYEPMIIRTLIEHYNGFEGKNVYTFSTSASSGGSTAHNSISGRVSGHMGSNLHLTSSELSSTENRVREWLSGLNLLKGQNK